MKHSNKEIQEIIQAVSFIKNFEDQTILITGATGLIGSAVVETIKLFNESASKPIKQVLLVRDIARASSKLGENEYIRYIQGSIESLPSIEAEIDYILHGASPTSSKNFIEKPVDVLKAGLLGSFNMLELAKAKQVKKIIFFSSMEVYGTLQTFEAKETDYGLIDWIAIRSSYIEAKRASENIFLSYHSQHGVPSVVARLPQILTSNFDANDNRVYAQFIRAVKNDQDIVLKTKGETVRNYCYLTDAITGLLTLLSKGESGEIYNIANEETACSIKEMAELIIELSKTYSQPVFDIQEDPTKLGYLPTVKIKLMSEKLQNLGWRPQIGLKEAFLRMLA
jgi:dTDP-glucose 4,6-dehydratase